MMDSTKKECAPGQMKQSHSRGAGSENWIRDQGQRMRGDSERRGTTREWSYNDDGEKESCCSRGTGMRGVVREYKMVLREQIYERNVPGGTNLS